MLRKLLCKLFWKYIFTKIANNEKHNCEFLGIDLCETHNHRIRFKYDLNKYFSVYKNDETKEHYIVYDNRIILTRKGKCIATLKNFKRNVVILKAISELIIDCNKHFSKEETNSICQNLINCTWQTFKYNHDKLMVI